MLHLTLSSNLMQPPEMFQRRKVSANLEQKNPFIVFILLGLPVPTTMERGDEGKGVSKMQACNLDIDCTYWKSGEVKRF